MNLYAVFFGAECIFDRLVGAKCLARRLGPKDGDCRIANAVPGQFTGRPVANDVHNGVDI